MESTQPQALLLFQNPHRGIYITVWSFISKHMCMLSDIDKDVLRLNSPELLHNMAVISSYLKRGNSDVVARL